MSYSNIQFFLIIFVLKSLAKKFIQIKPLFSDVFVKRGLIESALRNHVNLKFSIWSLGK